MKSEITPKMIKAGLKAYLDWLPGDAFREPDEESMVMAVFSAMRSASDETMTAQPPAKDAPPS